MSLFKTVVDFLKPAPPLRPEVARALDRVADLVDPMLKNVRGFERRLAGPLEHALGYCEGLVSGLPGPIDMDREAFGNDPLVHALFATAGDIDQMLGRSQAVRDFVVAPECLESDHFYALFAARRHQKTQLGTSRQGDVIQGDVPQVVIYFADQLLAEPNCQLSALKANLRCRTLESLLLTFREHVDALRLERDGLRADTSLERANLIGRAGRNPGTGVPVPTRQLKDLEARLRATAESLMPDQIFDALAEFLLHPEASLSAISTRITVDRLGVVCEEDADDANVSTLDFPEMRGRDKRVYMVTLTRVRRDEALAAVELVRYQQNRFMFI